MGNILSIRKDTVKNIPGMNNELLGHVYYFSYPLISVNIEINLIVPGSVNFLVPVMMEFGFTFRSNFKMTDKMKNLIDSMSNWQPEVLSKGWGYVILYPTNFRKIMVPDLQMEL